MIDDLRTRFGGFRLSRLNGRPRKLAALTCLVLAGISAVSGGGHARASNSRQPQPGHVAVALTLADGGAGRGFLRPGERIDLISDTADISLRDVAVLSVSRESTAAGLMHSTSGESDGTNLVVGVDPKDIATLTALTTRRTFAAPHDQG